MGESLNNNLRIHEANQGNEESKNTSRKSVLWGTKAPKRNPWCSQTRSQTKGMRTSSRLTAARACNTFILASTKYIRICFLSLERHDSIGVWISTPSPCIWPVSLPQFPLKLIIVPTPESSPEPHGRWYQLSTGGCQFCRKFSTKSRSCSYEAEFSLDLGWILWAKQKTQDPLSKSEESQ